MIGLESVDSPSAAESGEAPGLGWCLVEVMGHTRYAGIVSETVVAGVAFVQVDVPALGPLPGFRKLLGVSSIFSLTPVDEATGLAVARGLRARPIPLAYTPLPELPAYDDDDDQVVDDEGDLPF